ncbi:MAG TPA: alpha/beta fold hydrolase [Woeseiaceae bacterium]|nr:alpha/beta fold hydrolase [Woeseiaceae bacterium]
MLAADGYRLAASLFGAGDSDTVVLINPATAVPRHFYRRFARIVQARGWHAVTYDYRGIGGSKPPSLRGFAVRMRDWALLDMTAMVVWVSTTLSPRRLFVVGHSFGGQVTGLLENAARIDAMVGVSAQSGYWGVQGGREPLKVRLIVTAVIPLLARLVGYFPWSWFASGADLPRGVALEWARWCRDPDYLLGDETLPLARYRAFTAAVLAYSIEDDDWGTQRAVDDMMRAYPNVERRHLRAADYGLARLGHTGYFREGSEALWREALDWLAAQPEIDR